MVLCFLDASPPHHTFIKKCPVCHDMSRWVLGIALSFVLLVPLTSADNASTGALEGGYHDPLYVNSMVPYLNSSATGGAEDILTWSGTTFELDNAQAALEVQQNGTLEVLTSSGDIELRPEGNVGVGVDNPTKALSVNGSISSAGNVTKNGREVATEVYVKTEAVLRNNISGPRGALQFANGSKLDEAADLVYNATSDRLGVATMSPDETLDINGTVAVRYGTNISDFSTDESLSGDSDGALPTEQAVKQYVDSSPGGSQGAVQFNKAPGFDGDVDILFVNQSTGQIGVGTRNPSDTFEVNGTARFIDNISVDNSKYLNFLNSAGNPNSYIYRGEGDDLFLVNEGDGQNIKNIVQADGGFYVQNNTYSTLFKVGGQGSASLRGDLNFLNSYQNIYGDNLKIWGASDTSLNLQPPSSSTGNVGINTINPSVELDVNGSVAVKRGTKISEFSQDAALADASSDALPTEQAVKNYVDTTADAIGLADVLSTNDRADDGQQIEGDRLRARDSDGLSLYDDGGNGIFIQDGGNVGIGTDSPTRALHIQGDLNVTGTSYLGSTRIESKKIETNAIRSIDGYIAFQNEAGTEQVRLQSNGNVGIGTDSPSQRLDVAGSAVLNSGTAVSEFSTDEALSDNSDEAVPTEQAVKQYQESNDFDSWIIAGDSGSSTVSNGETLTVSGGSGVDTLESSRSVTVDVRTGTGVETNSGVVRLSTGAAGSGLGGGGGSALSVNTGNAVTGNGDDVGVSSGGIADDEIQDNTVDNSEIENTASFTFNGVTSNSDIDAQNNDVDNVNCLGDQCA